MKTITKQTTVTTERGTVIEMTVTAVRGFEMVKEVAFCDGDNIEITKGKKTNETNIVLLINGKEYQGFLTDNWSPVNKIAFVAGKAIIPLSKQNYDELMSVIIDAKEEAETDNTWIAKIDKEAKNVKIEQEYEAHVKALDKMMDC